MIPKSQYINDWGKFLRLCLIEYAISPSFKRQIDASWVNIGQLAYMGKEIERTAFIRRDNVLIGKN